MVRGGEGVLLSTHARPQQGTSVTSTQMDAKESLAQLKSAQQLTQALADAATHQSAGTSCVGKLLSKQAAWQQADGQGKPQELRE